MLESLVQASGARADPDPMRCTRKRHPLDEMDFSKLDKVTLSDKSIELVTKLLQDLNIVKKVEEETPPDTDDDDNETQLEIKQEDIDELDDALLRQNGTSGGYVEYEDDFHDEEEAQDSLLHNKNTAELL